MIRLDLMFSQQKCFTLLYELGSLSFLLSIVMHSPGKTFYQSNVAYARLFGRTKMCQQTEIITKEIKGSSEEEINK